jgi:chromosome segregation ATPase
MMRYLMSILSIRKSENEVTRQEVEALQCSLNDAHAQIAELNDAIKTLAHSYVALTQEVSCVSEIIRQAVNMANQGEVDLLSFHNDADDSGYLN